MVYYGAGNAVKEGEGGRGEAGHAHRKHRRGGGGRRGARKPAACVGRRTPITPYLLGHVRLGADDRLRLDLGDARAQQLRRDARRAEVCELGEQPAPAAVVDDAAGGVDPLIERAAFP